MTKCSTLMHHNWSWGMDYCLAYEHHVTGSNIVLQSTKFYVRFVGHMAVNMTVTVFRDVRPCSVV
jgi:hypothetical protein